MKMNNWPAPNGEERELRIELMKALLNLYQKQAFWETPRNLAIVVGASVAITSAIAGFVGFKIGQTPQPPIIINLPPR